MRILAIALAACAAAPCQAEVTVEVSIPVFVLQQQADIPEPLPPQVLGGPVQTRQTPLQKQPTPTTTYQTPTQKTPTVTTKLNGPTQKGPVSRIRDRSRTVTRTRRVEREGPDPGGIIGFLGRCLIGRRLD